MSEKRMTDKDIELFVKPNPDAYRRFKSSRRKKTASLYAKRLKSGWKIISNIILWICAVGGFVLALIQFLQN